LIKKDFADIYYDYGIFEKMMTLLEKGNHNNEIIEILISFSRNNQEFNEFMVFSD